LNFRQDNDRLHMELDRCRDLGPYGRSRSPEPTYGQRNSHEVADLKDKLEATQSELRRAQAELRLNQSDYDRSHVELEQMQEKVRKLMQIITYLAKISDNVHS
jgi:hypothetical protein